MRKARVAIVVFPGAAARNTEVNTATPTEPIVEIPVSAALTRVFRSTLS